MEGKNGTIDKTDKKEKRTDTKIRRGRRRCRCCGDHSDSCRNINPLLWGGYKVYSVKYVDK